MKKFLVILFMLISCVQNFSQEKISVKIEVQTKNLSDTDNVFISGNHSLLGYWHSSKIKLDKINDSIFAKIFQFEKGDEISFKFTLGNWAEEALKDDGTVPGNINLKIEKDTVISVKINKWKNENFVPKGKITGEVKYHKNVSGKGIKDRNIIVWLPPSYSRENSKKYPVLYMHDGQNIVDPETSSMGIDWGIDEAADSLIRQNKIREIIIVGIYNSSDRSAEYSHSDLGEKYMNFIVNELKPFIDKNYRTKSDRENTATMGSSMGGLISLMLVWEHSETFSQAGCLSPAFKVAEFDYIPWIQKYTGKKKDIKIYVDNGGVGVEERLQPGIEETLAELEKRGYKEGKELSVYFDKDAEHNEAAWSNRIWRPLIFMFGK